MLFYPYVLLIKSFFNEEKKKEWDYVKEMDDYGIKFKYSMWIYLVSYLMVLFGLLLVFLKEVLNINIIC